MYRLTIITVIGNYKVEMQASTENPTYDDLMGLFHDTASDVRNGCFMEGWTPEAPTGEPGVFALEKDLDILAYHVERLPDVSEFEEVKEVKEEKTTVKPVAFSVAYLGNNLHIKTVVKSINDVSVVYCYEVDGLPPVDVLSSERLHDIIADYLINVVGLDADDFNVYISEDGVPRNFSQAVDMLNKSAETKDRLTTKRTGKAWDGWKGEPE